MFSMQDMFYSNAEPVWIVKPPSAEEKKKQAAEAAGKKEKEEEYSILTAIPNYPYYYPPYNAPATPAAKGEDEKKETKLALRVSICCAECEDVIKGALKQVPGVKDVDCNIFHEKVVVTCTTAASADVILAARREFKHAREWTDDD